MPLDSVTLISTPVLPAVPVRGPNHLSVPDPVTGTVGHGERGIEPLRPVHPYQRNDRQADRAHHRARVPHRGASKGSSKEDPDIDTRWVRVNLGSSEVQAWV